MFTVSVSLEVSDNTLCGFAYFLYLRNFDKFKPDIYVIKKKICRLQSKTDR